MTNDYQKYVAWYKLHPQNWNILLKSLNLKNHRKDYLDIFFEKDISSYDIYGLIIHYKPFHNG